MTRSRLVLLSATLVVAIGAAAALGAFFLDPARASVGPLPAVALSLPADSTFVVGLDVKRFVASPFFRKFASGPEGRIQPFADLEEKTGIDPRRDVEQLVLAGAKGSADESGTVLVQGRFDQARVSRAIETEHKGVTWKKVQGTTLYLFGEGSHGAGAAAFLDQSTLVLGTARSVESTIVNHASGNRALAGNAALMDLVGRVKPGSTFWMVGDQSLLSHLPTALPAPGAAAGSGSHSSVTLPALKSLMVTGDLDPVVALDVTGQATDEAGARNLADVVRGFLALASLQAEQKPELKALAAAVSVTTEASQVHLTARVPYGLIDSLRAPKEAAPRSAGK